MNTYPPSCPARRSKPRHRGLASGDARRRGQSITEMVIFIPILVTLMMGTTYLVRLAAARSRANAMAHTQSRMISLGHDPLDQSALAQAFGMNTDRIEVVAAAEADASGPIRDALLAVTEAGSESRLGDLLTHGLGRSTKVNIRLRNPLKPGKPPQMTSVQGERMVPGMSWEPGDVEKGLQKAVNELARRLQNNADYRDILRNAVPTGDN